MNDRQRLIHRRRGLGSIAATFLALTLILLPGSLAAQEEPDNFAALMAKKSDLDAETLNAIQEGQGVEVLVTFRDKDDNAVHMLKQSVDEEEGLQAQLEYRAAVWGLYKGSVFQDLEEQDMAVEVTRDYDNLPIALVQVQSQEQLETLASHPDVLGVSQDQWMYPALSQSLPQINHAQAEAKLAQHGMLLGQYGSVAVIDTGVDYTHPDFGSCDAAGDPGCAVSIARDFAPDDGALDDHGHGTNVAGIVHGVAPGAKILALDVFQRDSRGNLGALTSDIIDAINWVIRNTYWHKVKAINLSLGGPRRYTFCTSDLTFSPYRQAFELARDYGIMPVVASGNDGHANYVAEPACSNQAVAVGAVLDHTVPPGNGYSYPLAGCTDPVGTPIDTVNCFSNGGPELELLAPGTLITAAGITFPGTSQAAPHVAGAAAALRSFYRWESVEETLTRLTASGTPITDGRNGQVFPRLDLGAAMGIDPCAINPLAPGCVIGRDDCGQRYDGPICDHFRDGILDLCVVKPWICVEPWPEIPLIDFDPERFRGRRFW
ncbi:MAG: S8 family serine peptidase [Acidobacteriota bacterium]|nr:S8 family serine peptidase [Acidobacteriota bacterium]